MEYATQAAQPGFPGNYMNQNSHPGYPHMGPNNDIASQVRNWVLRCIQFLLPFIWAVAYIIFFQEHLGPGSHGMFTHASYADPSQEDSSQLHFPPLQSQV
jgi:regulator of nonsense transcripts 1